MIFRLILLGLLGMLGTSCARTFVKPDLTVADYTPAGSMESRLDFDLSQEAIPIPYAFMKRLKKRKLELHAVRVRNYTSDTLWLRAQDVTLLSNGSPVQEAAPAKIYKALKQPVAVHALWFLLGPFVRSEEGDTKIDYHPLGVAAVAWGIRSGVVAYKSNREVKELLQYTMPAADTPIAPGGAIYLLKALPAGNDYSNLELRYTELTRND